MELALLMLIVSFVELALTVWLLARHRDYLARVRDLELRVSALSDGQPSGAVPVSPTDEQVRMVLDALGGGRADG